MYIKYTNIIAEKQNIKVQMYYTSLRWIYIYIYIFFMKGVFYVHFILISGENTKNFPSRTVLSQIENLFRIRKL